MTKPIVQQPRRRRRTRRDSIAELLRKIGEEPIEFRDSSSQGTFDFGDPVEISELSRRECMVHVLWAAALDGNLKAIQLILDYTDGRPAQAVAVGVGIRFTADEYARAEKRLAAWRALQGRPALPAPGIDAEPDDNE